MASTGGSGRPTDYAWDVFVSYSREPLVTPWVQEVVRRLSMWLRHEVGGRPVAVFLDTEHIQIADHWPDALRQAVLTSRCLVPVLSPEYFHCPWCVFEWNSFLARQRLAGEPIIAPLRIHDGIWFPPEARDIQMLDVERLVGTTPAFWETRRADELDQLLRDFAGRVGELVLRAPPFSADWPIDDRPPNRPPRHVPRRGL